MEARPAEEETGPVSVELLLDPASDARVRAEWAALAARGMSSLAARGGTGNQPHITLFEGARECDLGALSGPALAVPFPVRLGEPVAFGSGDRRVLARSVVRDAALLELQAAVHRQLRERAPLDAVDHLHPSRWAPHVTLARRLRPASLDEALALLVDEIQGEVVAVRAWNAATRTVTVLAGASGP